MWLQKTWHINWFECYCINIYLYLHFTTTRCMIHKKKKISFSFMFHWRKSDATLIFNLFWFQSYHEMNKNQILLQDGLVVMNVSKVSEARGFVTSNFMAVAEIETGKRRLKNVWHQQNLYENVKWWNIVREDKIFRSVTNAWTNVEWYNVSCKHL